MRCEKKYTTEYKRAYAGDVQYVYINKYTRVYTDGVRNFLIKDRFRELRLGSLSEIDRYPSAPVCRRPDIDAAVQVALRARNKWVSLSLSLPPLSSPLQISYVYGTVKVTAALTHDAKPSSSFIAHRRAG